MRSKKSGVISVTGVSFVAALVACGSHGGGASGSLASIAAAMSAASSPTPTTTSSSAVSSVGSGAAVRASVATLAGSPLEPASVVAGVVRDRLGRQLLLRGATVSERAKRPPFTGWLAESHFDDCVRLGFDHVRLLLTWEAIEPQDGKFDDVYLDEVRRALGWCEARGIRVILDMHQDMFARRFGGDGAPDWALAPDPFPWLADIIAPFPANYLNPKVIAQFDAFHHDPARRARLARAWAHAASRLKSSPAVLGYDLLNEPFPGSELPPWTFEAQSLATLERELAAAIRAEDPDRIVFFEPQLMAAGLFTGLPGPPCANAVYAPHFYDPVVEVRAAQNAQPIYDGNRARLAFFLDDLASQARALGVPWWLGEWGIERRRSGSIDYVRDHESLFDEKMLSAAYWNYDPIDDEIFTPVGKSGDYAVAAELARPHPRAIAGTLARVAFDAATTTLTVEWDEASPPVAAPTIVELPWKTYAPGRALDVTLSDPPGIARTERDARTGRLLVFADPSRAHHVLVVKPH